MFQPKKFLAFLLDQWGLNFWGCFYMIQEASIAICRYSIWKNQYLHSTVVLFHTADLLQSFKMHAFLKGGNAPIKEKPADGNKSTVSRWEERGEKAPLPG